MANSRLKIIFIIVATALSLLTAMGSDAHKSQPANTGIKQMVVAQPDKPQKPVIYEDFTLGNFTPGQSVLALQQPGSPQPQQIVPAEDNTIYDYGNAQVTVSAQNRIVKIFTDSPQMKSQRGISPGSSLAEVRSAYGDNAAVTNCGEYTLYDYMYFAMPEQKFILRFAVKTGTKTVSYMESAILGEDRIERIIFSEIKPEDITGTWWTDFGYWAFKLKLKVADGELVGTHAGNYRYGAKIEKEPREPSIHAAFEHVSPVKVRFKSSWGVEGNAWITPLNKDCMWWHIVSVDKPGEFYLPHDAVLYREKT